LKIGPVAAQTSITPIATLNVTGWPAAADVWLAHQLKNLRMRP
jgi:hypothetical protein